MAAASRSKTSPAPASLLIDAGVAYIPRENWQFDVSAGRRALGNASALGFVSIGIAYRHK
jgi:hypothetical protein